MGADEAGGTSDKDMSVSVSSMDVAKSLDEVNTYEGCWNTIFLCQAQ